MSTHKVIAATLDNAAAVTLGGAGSAVMFWGLHISDIAVIVSAFAAVLGVVLQFYVAMRRLHILERDVQAAKIVATAGAAATRAVTAQVKAVSDRLDA